MSSAIMPKAVAVWLVDNTGLTFEQISDFCGLQILDIQAAADGDGEFGDIIGVDPVKSGQLTYEEIDSCTRDPLRRLVPRTEYDELQKLSERRGRSRRKKYTPVARRQDKPDAIAWLLRNCPEIEDAHIMKLIGTTKHTVMSVREKTHWNSQSIKPRHPVLLGLCTQDDFDQLLFRARMTAERAAKMKEINQRVVTVSERNK